MALELTARDDGTIVPIRAHPGARKDAILGERQGSLRVGVTAPPEKGKANAAIVTVLATALGLAKSRVVLVSGETSREKRFLVLGCPPDQLRARLAASTPSTGSE